MNFFTTSLPGVMKIEPSLNEILGKKILKDKSTKEFNKFLKDLNLENAYELSINRGVKMDFDFTSSSGLVRCIIGKVEIEVISGNNEKKLVETLTEENHFQIFIQQGYQINLTSLDDKSIIEINTDKEQLPF